MEIMQIAGLNDLYGFRRSSTSCSRSSSSSEYIHANVRSVEENPTPPPPPNAPIENRENATKIVGQQQEDVSCCSSSLLLLQSLFLKKQFAPLTNTPTMNEQGLFIPPPNEPGDPYVNVYMLVDPRTMTCMVPKQIISYKQTNSVVSTAVFGPKVLDQVPTTTTTSQSSHLPQQQQQHLPHRETTTTTTTCAGAGPSNNTSTSTITEATLRNMLCPLSSSFPVPHPTLKNITKNTNDMLLQQQPKMSMELSSSVSSSMIWQHSSLLLPNSNEKETNKPQDNNNDKDDIDEECSSFASSRVPLPAFSAAAAVAAAAAAAVATSETTTEMTEETSSSSSAQPLPPLRALSAYNFFFRDERERVLYGVGPDWSEEKKLKLLEEHWFQDRHKKRRHRKTHGKIDFTTLSKLISVRWKELPDHRKDFYRQIASRDFDRFKRQAREQQQQEQSQQERTQQAQTTTTLPTVALHAHTSVVG